MPLDVVHEDERKVKRVGCVGEVVASCPVERSSPGDGRVKPIEIREGMEEPLIEELVSLFGPVQACPLANTRTVLLSTGPNDTSP